MGEPEGKQTDTAVHGDVVGGDKTTVGDVTNAKGVAVGRGSTVIINEIPKPLLVLLGGLVVTVILITTMLLFWPFTVEEKPLELTNLSEPLLDVFTDTDSIQDVIIREDFVWFGTSRGLLAYDEEDRRSEWLLQGEEITSMAEGSEQIWVGTNNGHLIRVFPFDTVIAVDTLPESSVSAIFVDETEQAWVAYSGQGIWLYGADGALLDKTIQLPGGLLVFDLAVLTSSEQRIIWALTFAGLYRWKDGRWDIFDDGDGIPPEAVLNKVVVDSSKGSWFAHSDGMTHLRFSDESLSRGGIESITCTSSEHELPSGEISDFVIDSGWLWLVTSNGIARKRLDSEGFTICEQWQSYQAEGNDQWPPNEFWRFDARNSNCSSWLVASSRYKAFRLNFEC